MVTVQLDDAARLAPQVLLEIAKSAASAPEIAILVIEIAEAPILLNATLCGVLVEPRGTLPHERLLGSTRTPATPQPVNVRTIRRIGGRSRLSAQCRPTVLCWFVLRVIVTSSCFLCLMVSARRQE